MLDSRDISHDISTKFAARSLEVHESQVRMEIAAMELGERVAELEERRDGGTIPKRHVCYGLRMPGPLCEHGRG